MAKKEESAKKPLWEQGELIESAKAEKQPLWAQDEIIQPAKTEAAKKNLWEQDEIIAPAKPAGDYPVLDFLSDAAKKASASIISGIGPAALGVEDAARNIPRNIKDVESISLPNLLYKGAEQVFKKEKSLITGEPYSFAKELVTGLQKKEQEKQQIDQAISSVPHIPGLQDLADWSQKTGQNIRNTISEQGQKASEDSRISGNIAKAIISNNYNNLSFGKDPSFAGYALNFSDVLGSLGPVLATALLTKSPTATAVVGGSMGAGEGVVEAQQYIGGMTDEQLAQNSPYYANMVRQGMDPAKARQIVTDKASEYAAQLQGAVAAFGSEFTGKLMTGAFDKVLNGYVKNRLGKMALGTVVGSAEEGTQEFIEGLAADLGINKAVVREIGTDSFANFILGAMGGIGPGAYAGYKAKTDATKEVNDKIDASDTEVDDEGARIQTRDKYIKTTRERVRAQAAKIKDAETTATKQAEPEAVIEAPVVETAAAPVTKLTKSTLNSLGFRTNTNAFRELDGVDIATPEGRELFEQTLEANQDKVKENKVKELLASLPPIETEAQDAAVDTSAEQTTDRTSLQAYDERGAEATEGAAAVVPGTVDVAGANVGQPTGGAKPGVDTLAVDEFIEVGGAKFRKTATGYERVEEPATEQPAPDVVTAWDRTNRSGRNEEWQAGAAESNPAFNAVDGNTIPAHGMAKTATLTEAYNNLVNLLKNGIDPNRTLFTAGLTAQEGTGSASGTAGGYAYRDGPFILTFREGLQGQPTTNDITGVLVNPANAELVPTLQEMFPDLVVRDYNNVSDVVEASRTQAQAPESTEVMMSEEELQAEADAAKFQQQAQNLSRELRNLDPTNPLIEDLLAYDVNEATIAEAKAEIANIARERQAKGQTTQGELRELSEEQKAAELDQQAESFADTVLGKTKGETATDEDTRFSKQAEGRPASMEDAHTAPSLTSALKTLFATPSSFRNKVKIYNTEQEARDAGVLPEGEENVQGFVSNGVAYFIANNIAKGREVGVFLHELGAHLGFDTLLGPKNREKLGNQIIEWASNPNGRSEANMLAIRATKRAQVEENGKIYADIDEVIAYFIEEAVNIGINPYAVNKIQDVGLRNWFRKIMSLLRSALRKIGQNKFDQLTPQNIVDLAYGAADLELSGAWHGTAADFRKFNHDYMGAGEGAQAFGWGTYLAQRRGIANEYMESDVQRKTKNKISVEDLENLPVDITGKYYGMSGTMYAIYPNSVIDVRPVSGNVYVKTEALTPSGIPAGTGSFYANLNELYNEDGSAAFDYEQTVAIRDAVNNAKQGMDTKGSLMRVRPLVAETALLDWDKPLDEQHITVEKALAAVPNDLKKRAAELSRTKNATGETLYRAIQEAADENLNIYSPKIWGDTEGTDTQKATSMYLDRLGIPGLKFFDQPSRKKPEYDRVEVRDAGYVASWMDGPWEVIKIGPGGGYTFGWYKTEAEANKASKLAEKEIEDEKANRTRNIVVFNDKNLSRVGTLKGGQAADIRYSKAKQQKVKQLQQKSGIKKPNNNTGKSLFQRVMDFDVKHAMDNFSSAVLSSDNALNNQMRRALEKSGMGWDQIKTVMQGLMTSQATHAQNVAHMFLEMGKITYDSVGNMFQVTNNDNGSWAKMMDTIGVIAKQYGMSTEDMELAAHTYFVANRARGLIKRNKEIEKKAIALELAGKRKEADKLLDKLVLVHMTPAQIKAGMDIRKEIPELGQVFEQWHAIRQEVITHLTNTGLYSQEQAAELWDTFDYVPFYREAQIEANQGPKEFTRGLLDRARQKHVKGSYNPVNNVFDNMNRWITYSIARGINNSQAAYTVKAMQQYMVGSISPKPLPPTTKVTPGNLVAVWENGVEKRYRAEDPLIVHYFTGARAAFAPFINNFAVSGTNKFFRASIILDPVFSLSQLVMDGITAMFTSGVKQYYMIPIRALTEFTLTIPNWSKTHKLLRGYGAVGETSYSEVSRRLSEEAKHGGRSMNMLEKIADTLVKPLRWITTASDNAIRQAVYAQTLKETGDKAQAIRAAFEIINFRRAGYSGLVNTVRQSVPFTGAYLQYINVTAKVLSGKGITPTQRKQTYMRLLNALGGYGLISFMMLLASSDDEDYKKADNTTRDSHIYLPEITEKTGIWLPVRPDPFTLVAKMIPEHILNLTRKEGGEDWTKFKKAFKDYLSNALLGPSPMPQLPKTALQAAINYDFNTGRPIVGQGVEGRAAEREFTINTSEIAKRVGKATGTSPMMIDYWLNNIGGSLSRSFVFLTNAALKDANAPEPSTREKWASFAPKFVQHEFGNRGKNDLYELRDVIEEAYATFKDIEKHGSKEEYDAAYKAYIDKIAQKPGIDQVVEQLGMLRDQERTIFENPPDNMTKQEKEDYLRYIRETEKVILRDIQLRRNLSGLDIGNPFRKSE